MNRGSGLKLKGLILQRKGQSPLILLAGERCDSRHTVNGTFSCKETGLPSVFCNSNVPLLGNCLICSFLHSQQHQQTSMPPTHFNSFCCCCCKGINTPNVSGSGKGKMWIIANVFGSRRTEAKEKCGVHPMVLAPAKEKYGIHTMFLVPEEQNHGMHTVFLATEEQRYWKDNMRALIPER